MRVFISHAKEDSETARRLYDDLEQTPGVEPWTADRDLLPGQDRKREIRRAIRGSRYFIAVLSSRALGRAGHVHKEMRLAMDALDEMPEGEIFVIPARVDECEPSHERLKDIRSADLFPDYEAGLAQIRKSLAADRASANGADDMADPTIRIPDPPSSEPAIRGEIPVNAEAETVRRLADALMRCPALIDPRTRALIVACLSPEISPRIDASGPPGTVVPEMVGRCMVYPGGLDRLMECVGHHERGSIPFSEAMRVRKELPGETTAAPDAGGSGASPPPDNDPALRNETASPVSPMPAERKTTADASDPTPEARKTHSRAAEKHVPSEAETKPADPPNAPWEKVAAFAFGIVFVVVMLAIALFVPEPKPFQEMLFRTVLALAAAGVGAVVPGMISVEWKNPKLRAAGAFALFVIVYLLNPPKL